MGAKGDFTAEPRLVVISAIALVIGAICAVVAVVLLKLIGFFTNLFFYQHLSLAFSNPARHHLGVGVIVVPVVGGLIIGLMARYGSERIRGHGIPEAMEAILIGRSKMQPKVAILKPLSSAISIGSGGPFGAEGPIIMTGGACGSIIAQVFHMTAAERKTLLVAGAAGGMSATFATPVAAVLLAVELLLFEWKPRSLVPVALASAVAAAMRPYLIGPGPLFPVPSHPLLGPVGLLACVAVGLLAGIASSLLTWGVYAAEDGFHRLPIHWMWWPALGGVAVGIGGLLQPHALGVGYDIIGQLLQGQFVPAAPASWLVPARRPQRRVSWLGRSGISAGEERRGGPPVGDNRVAMSDLGGSHGRGDPASTRKEVTMATTAADVLIDTIHDWGVEVIFGLPGDGINGIMETLRQRQDKIRFIHVRHEEAAAFMACAYAKYTGKLGVCLSTSGPGGIHLLNGLYDAKLDGQPVLAITGMAFHDLINTHQQQDVELDKLFEDVAVYNTRVMGPTHVENVADLACRTALSYRGVAHITFPVDLQDEPANRNRTKRNVPHHTSDVYARSARLPAEDDLRRAAEILNAGKKVAILAGRGAIGAADELEQAADRLAAPIVKPLLGKGAVPDHSPFTTGGIGLLGTLPSQEALEQCDTLLMVGTSFPYIEYFPKPDQAKGVQIELDPMRIGLRFPVEVGLVGDSRRTLQELLPLLQRKTGRHFLEHAQQKTQDWWRLMEEQGTRKDKPMKPQVVAYELGKRLRDDAIVSSDSGTIATWWARLIPAKRGQLYSLSGNLATMANGLPYTIAAQVAYPNRQCVAFVGDGGFSMLMADFSTAVKYKLPIKVVIIKNNTLGQIKWEQMVFLGNPEYGCDFLPIDFAAFARACGGTGFTIEDPAECGSILDQALATPGPVLVEAVVDPFEPPMPPKVSLDQATKFAKSLARGEPNREKIALTVLSDKVRELV